jgi:hypothetical protein
MNVERSLLIARLAFALLFSWLVVIGALPGSIKANAAHSHEHSSAQADHLETRLHGDGLVDLELCRPGLDCITVAVSDGAQEIPEPKQELTRLPRQYADLDSEGFEPRSYLPPPRV